MTAVSQRAPEGMYHPHANAIARDGAPAWHPATLVAFRFCFVYFGLYVLTTQMLPSLLPLPFINIPDLQSTPPVRALVVWVGQTILGHPVPIAPSGSGDKMFDWAHTFTVLTIALIATGVWSLLARTATSHDTLFKWFRLFLRFALGTSMLSYGFAKAVPLQMPTLALTKLVEPFGNFSPMGVLWYSIGAAPAYEIFAGLAEICGGALLFLPRTALLGALMCLMDTIAVFTLNMTYDVPVKLFSFHLVLMSLVLIVPNARRLFDLFVLHRAVEIKREPPVGNTDVARRVWGNAQIAFGLLVLIVGAWGDKTAYTQFGGGAPRSPLFGIWNVDAMTVDGQTHPPLLTDSTRWRRAIFQQPAGMTFQRPNDNFAFYSAKIDTVKRTLTLSPRAAAPSSTSPGDVLSYQRPTPGQLVFDGTMDGHPVHMELTFRDPDSFLQRSRGFHWVQELPFNR